MKKWFSIILALILVFSLAACGKKNAGSANEQSDQPAVNNETKDTESKKQDIGGLTLQEPSDGTSDTDAKTDTDNVTEPVSDTEAESEKKKESEKKAEPADGNGQAGTAAGDSVQGSDPYDDSEDVEVSDEFTGLEVGDEVVIEIGEGEGVGGF